MPGRRSFLAAAAAVAGLLPRRLAAQSGETKLRVGFQVAEPNGVIYYAAELGLFKAAGLDVDLQPFANPTAVAAALVAGALDVGATSLGPVVRAHVRGVPLTVIAPGALYVSARAATVLVVAKDSPIRSARDCNGKTIAISSIGELSQIALQSWIDGGGGDAKSVSFVEIPTPQMALAVQRGRVAVAQMVEPYYAQAKDDVRFLAPGFDGIAKTFMITVWNAERGWVDRNLALAKRFAGALAEAGQWANAHPAESAPIIAKATKIALETIRGMNRAQFARSLDGALMQPVIDAFVRYQAIPAGFPAAELIHPAMG